MSAPAATAALVPWEERERAALAVVGEALQQAQAVPRA
jgi:hypothetical protein